MKIEIKKLRSCNGTDGIAYSCELWVGGTKAADVVSGGNGAALAAETIELERMIQQ